MIAIVFWIPIFKIGEFNITILDSFLVLIISYFLIKRFGNQNKIKKEKDEINPILILTILFLIPGTISAFYFSGINIAIISFLLGMKKWLIYSVFLLLIPFMNSNSWKANLKIIIITILIMLGLNILSIISSEQLRIVSVFQNPNVYGIMCVFFFNISLGLITSTYVKGPLLKVSLIVSILFCVYGLVISGSRTAMFGFFLVTIYWLYSQKEKKAKLKLRSIILFGIFILIIFVLSNSNSLNRWNDLLSNKEDTASVAYRGDAIKVGLRMFLDSPIVGYGNSNFSEFSGNYVNENALLINNQIQTTDNQYTDILLEGGIVGLAIFIISILLMLKYLLKHIFGSTFAKISLANLILLIFAGFGMPSFYSPFSSAMYWYLFSFAVWEININETKIVNNKKY
ncbi:O-antigen ligase family protein [Paenisporosarcina indica]|uniref:O-antigen ligase family protein n=1 Tax=Paenisporosarcina indica TaxID=650093 RepID=UPI0013737E2C|nr:O-antigen ligase family protein [Paenisporosarcina indica]